jgi:hypothetical protein
MAEKIRSAEELRMSVLQKELDEMDRVEKAREKAKQELANFAKDFLGKHVNEDEITVINRLVMRAVADGKLEALVYSFPSDLCTDGGRAINNNAPDWPETLQGKAKELYDRFKTVAQPQGYRLKAMIINFPGGIPGDVGFFLSWAPPAV